MEQPQKTLYQRFEAVVGGGVLLMVSCALGIVCPSVIILKNMLELMHPKLDACIASLLLGYAVIAAFTWIQLRVIETYRSTSEGKGAMRKGVISGNIIAAYVFFRIVHAIAITSSIS